MVKCGLIEARKNFREFVGIKVLEPTYLLE